MSQSKTYQSQKDQLDDILVQLEQPDIDVEVAIKLYQKGLELSADLRQRLEQAKLKINKLAPDVAES